MADTDIAITDDWLLSSDFKWRQDERQPNKHYTLKINRINNGMLETSGIELQRCGWKNHKGDYVGDPNEWMVWVTDRFDSRVFFSHLQTQEQVQQLATLIAGYPWNPDNHIYGQAWPEGRKPS